MNAYRDQYAQLFRNGKDVVLIAISADADTMQAAWARESQFPFLFASDTGLAVGRAYGAIYSGRGVTLTNRQQGLPDHVLQIAWRAQHRLYRLHQRLRARGKPGNVAVVAVARELACFLWAAAVAD